MASPTLNIQPSQEKSCGGSVKISCRPQPPHSHLPSISMPCSSETQRVDYTSPTTTDDLIVENISTYHESMDRHQLPIFGIVPLEAPVHTCSWKHMALRNARTLFIIGATPHLFLRTTWYPTELVTTNTTRCFLCETEEEGAAMLAFYINMLSVSPPSVSHLNRTIHTFTLLNDIQCINGWSVYVRVVLITLTDLVHIFYGC